MDIEVRRARALASPLRLRILRVCLHEPHTNKQIAEALGLSPATALHHVRTLVATGFLAPQDERRGQRGAREVPYLATRASIDVDAGDQMNEMLVATTLQEVSGLRPNNSLAIRVGVKVSWARLAEFRQRLEDLGKEFFAEPTDPQGEAWSALLVLHRDPQAD